MSLPCPSSFRLTRADEDHRIASNKQHLALFLNGLSYRQRHRFFPSASTGTDSHLGALVVVIDHVDSFRDVSKDDVAVAIVCLIKHRQQTGSKGSRCQDRTCKRPYNSRSPRSFTNTISSRQRRTRSRGSLDSLESAMAPCCRYLPMRKWEVYCAKLEFQFDNHQELCVVRAS